MIDRIIPRSADGRFAPHEDVRNLLAQPDEWIFESLWRRILAHANQPVSVIIPGRRRQRMTRVEALVLELALGSAGNARKVVRYITLVRRAIETVVEIDRHEHDIAVKEALSVEMTAALEANDDARWRAALRRFIDHINLAGLSEREMIAALGNVQKTQAGRAGS
jgi:hypothetical protein